MRHPSAILLRLALAVMAGSVPCLSAAQEPSRFEPQQGVLVLSNGQTLEGKITRAGDRYCVVLKGGEINLPAGQVVLQCRDLPEAYERQRNARIEPRVQDHLKLAKWCLQNKLATEARQELDDAAQLEPNNPNIAVLRRRLEIVQQPPKVRTASHAEAPVSADELDRMVRSMPPGAMEGFTNTVQPLLLNQCATAACHGGQSAQSLRLLRGAGGRPPSRRLTQRNLHQLLAFIDRQLPAQSQVLKAAGEPHGSSQAPILKGRDSEQFRQLAEWVHMVSQTPDPKAPAMLPVDPNATVRNMESPTPSGTKVEAAKPQDPSRHDVKLTSQWSQIEGDEEFRVAEDGTILTNLPDDQIAEEKRDKHILEKKPPIRGAAGMANRTNVKRGAVPQVISRDPHDPELFNRQFHPPQ